MVDYLRRTEDSLRDLSCCAETRRQLNQLLADYEVFRLLYLNRVLSDGGLAPGTDTTKVQNAATINYTVNGAFFSKAATDNFWTLTGATVPDGSFQKWLLCIDAAGAASVVAGTPATTASGVVLGAVPADKAVVGMLQIQTVGAAFVPGTTALDAAEVTDTYTDGWPAALFPFNAKGVKDHLDP